MKIVYNESKLRKGRVLMPTIKPIFDLRNYSAVLQDVAFGIPVYLAKNGRACSAIIDIAEQEEYEKTKAALRLMCELNKGWKASEEQGYRVMNGQRDYFRQLFCMSHIQIADDEEVLEASEKLMKRNRDVYEKLK